MDGSQTAEGPRRGKLVATALNGAWRRTQPPPNRSPAELAEITPLLLGSGAAALGWWRVSHSKLQSCPAAIQLKQGYRLHILQTAIHESQIQKAFAVLRSTGVEPLLAKGWAAAQLYPEQGLRPYGDIDLYVRPEQHRAARIALSTGVPPGPVDLHRGFHELDDRSFEELCGRSRQGNLGGVEVSSVNYPSRSATTRIPVTYLLIFLRYIAAKWQCPLRGRAGGSGRLKKMRSILVRSRRRGHGAGGADRGSSK